MTRFLFTLFLIFLLSSCGQTPEQKRDEAILMANIYLTKRQYTEAINVLEQAGRDPLNATYMRVLSSAYAGKGGFDAIQLVANDLTLFADPTPLAGTSRFVTSDDMQSATDSDYTNLQTAIDLLLYAGNLPTDQDPTPQARAAVFTSIDAAEINMQLIYMLMVQLGRYFNYYGNTSAAGIKGGGAGSNSCFISYENLAIAGPVASDLNTFFGTAVTGGCNAGNYNTGGHPDLGDVPNTYNTARLCQGVVLLNAFFSIFPAVLSNIAGNDFPWVNSLKTLIETAKSLIDQAIVGANTRVTNVISQSKCETLNASDNDYLQMYFALMMETLLK